MTSRRATTVLLTLAVLCAGLPLGCAHNPALLDPVTRPVGSVHPALAMRPIPEGLGVNIHFYGGNDKDWSMITEAGIGIVRMDVSWAGRERERGVYDFSETDILVNRLAEEGMRLVFIVNYGNPLYDDGFPPHTDESRQACARFCAALAKHYAGREIIWELWNEPNIARFWGPEPSVDDYMAWCRTVVPAIRKADPNACIVGPANYSLMMTFLERCMERGFLELVDGVSVHPYRVTEPESALPGYERLSALIEEHRPADAQCRNIPILSGEWGYSMTKVDAATQAKYLVRQWLMHQACGIPVSIWYDWHDDGQDPDEFEHHFGTVTWDYAPKPTYIAMKTLITELEGFVPVGRLGIDGRDDYVVVFRDEDAYKIAAWTTSDAHAARIGQGLRVARAVSHLGEPLGIESCSTLALDDAPVYLELAGPVPAWIRALDAVE